LQTERKFKEAVEKYQIILRDYPATPAAGQTGSLMTETCDKWVDFLLESSNRQRALQGFWDLGTLCADLPAAARARTAVQDWFVQAQQNMKAGAYCEALSSFRDFVGANGYYRAEAQEAMPEALYRCGVAWHTDGEFATAEQLYNELMRQYADDPYAEQARQARVALTIDTRVSKLLKGYVSEQQPLEVSGYTSAGAVILEIRNDSQRRLEVLVSAPGPASQSMTIEACDSCPPYSLIGPLFGCRSSAPVGSLRLAPGTYTVVIVPAGGSPMVFRDWEMRSGREYGGCHYAVQWQW
jgi:tetratricopeptide (TPR) repeat protein